MIIWVIAESVQANCNQRVSVVSTQDDESVLVIMCGTGESKLIKTGDIIGLELSPTLTIYFGVNGLKRKS